MSHGACYAYNGAAKYWEQEGRILAYGNAKVLPLKSVESLDAVLLRKDEAPLASPMVSTNMWVFALMAP